MPGRKTLAKNGTVGLWVTQGQSTGRDSSGVTHGSKVINSAQIRESRGRTEADERVKLINKKKREDGCGSGARKG